jgi:hypothetical protein
MTGTVPVEEWYRFFQQVPSWGDEPAIYSSGNSDERTDEVETLEIMKLFATASRLPTKVLRGLALFIRTDTNEQVPPRMRAELAQIRKGPLTLAVKTYIILYFYVFCQGLMLDSLANDGYVEPESTYADTEFEFMRSPASLTFVLEAENVDEDHYLVSIKRDLDHEVVVLLYSITRSKYKSADESAPEARLRVRGARFDTRIAESERAPTALENLYTVDPTTLTVGDTVYELVRLLYAQYCGTFSGPFLEEIPLEVCDRRIAQELRKEMPRGAWFVATLEWMARDKPANALFYSRFLEKTVRNAQRAILDAEEAKESTENKAVSSESTGDSRAPTALLNALQQSLIADVQQLMGNLFVSSAAAYLWADKLFWVIWRPLVLARWTLSEQQRTAAEWPELADYFDSPYERLRKTVPLGGTAVRQAPSEREELPPTLLVVSDSDTESSASSDQPNEAARKRTRTKTKVSTN